MRWMKPKHFVVGLVVAVAVFSGLMWKSRRDERQDFEAYRQQLLASGAKLTMAETMPPPVATGAVWRAEMERLSGRLNSVLERIGSNAECAVGDATNGFRPVWMLDRIIGVGQVVWTWEELAEAVDESGGKLDALLLLLAEPVPRSDIAYSLGGTNHLNFAALRRTASVLKAEFLNAERSGPTNDSIRYLEALANLCRSHREDASFISLMVRSAISGTLNDLITAKLIAPEHSDAELLRIERVVGHAEVLSSTRSALLTERAQVSELVDWHFSGRTEEIRALMGTPQGNTWEVRAGEMVKNLVDPIPVGPAQAKRALMMQTEVVDLFDKRPDELTFKNVSSVVQAQTKLVSGPDSKQLLGGYKLAFISFGKAADYLFANEARRRLNQTAIGIERFRIRHGRLPERLDELVPEFMETLPVDPMDGNPMRYRRSSTGIFHLYSIGTDLVDGGGVGTGKHGAKDLVFPSPVPR